MRFRILASISIVGGIAAGMLFPSLVSSSGVTGYTLIASMAPPTLSSGSTPLNSCGWHNVCESGGGGPPSTALDWADGGEAPQPWYFRGYFVTSNPAPQNIATGYPIFVQGGNLVCDKMTVWIAEKHNGELRAAPVYTHTNITNWGGFSIVGSLFGTYKNKLIGNTIDDTGCPFYGSHVHETHVVVPNQPDVTTNLHTSRYPTLANCGLGGPSCTTHQNNLRQAWTRKFSWPEGK